MQTTPLSEKNEVVVWFWKHLHFTFLDPFIQISSLKWGIKLAPKIIAVHAIDADHKSTDYNIYKLLFLAP